MPFVYGFRQLPKKAEIYTHPFSGVAIATPVLDLLMRQDNGVVTDRTSYGNNGTCVGCVGARGVFDEGQKFDGVNDTINCGSNPSLDIAQDISVVYWLKSLAAGVGYIVTKTAGGVTGWQFVHMPAGDGRLWYHSYDGPTALLGVNNILLGGGLRHCALTNASGIARLFLDGLQEGRGAVTASDAPAASLYLMCFNGTSDWTAGLLELPQVFSGALSPEQVYRKYLEAKDVPIYLDDFSSYPVDFAPKTAGAMCGPFSVQWNFLSITVDVNGKKWVQGGQAGIYNYGAGSWPENNAYGTWEFDIYIGTEPAVDHLYFMPIATVFITYGNPPLAGYLLAVSAGNAVILYCITGGGAVAAPITSVLGTVTLDTQLVLRIVRRVDGQFTLYIKGGASPDWTLIDCTGTGTTNPTVDNTHTTSGYNNIVMRATSKLSNIKFTRVCERPASFPWEFSTGTYAGVVSGSTVWMRCLTAGVTYLPKDLDWLQMNFGIYKGADANVTDLLFIATEIGGTTFANQNGYCLRLAADESIQLIRTSAGIETQLATTAAGYIAINTEYEIKITHDWSIHWFAFYIRGGAYADWTLFSQFGLGIYSSSNYTTWDLDAGDRATAPTFRSFPR